MTLCSLDMGCPEIGTIVANLLENGDIIRWGPGGPVVQSRDIMLRLRALAVHAKVRRVPPEAYAKEKDANHSGEFPLVQPCRYSVGISLGSEMGFLWAGVGPLVGQR